MFKELVKREPEKKLIKGVIYDNPVEKKHQTIQTVAALHNVTDTADQCNEIIQSLENNGDWYTPTRNEFLVSYTVMNLLYPNITDTEVGEKNLLIPSHLLDKKLYDTLKQVDIGEEVMKRYTTDRKCMADCKENNNVKEIENKNEVSIEQVDENGNIIKSFKFDDKISAFNFIYELNNSGQINNEDAMKLIEDVINKHSN